MKKMTLVAAAAGCLLAAALNCSAFKEVAPPTLLPDGKVVFHIQTGANVFVGHYGEVLSYDEHWTAEPEMQGLMEVVRFHAQTRGRDKSGNLTFAPYHPKSEEYVPEKFASMELAQLIVIPKNAPNGFPSLRKLRAAKEKELALSGMGYKILPPGHNDLDWPQDTFFVSISTPYQLFQQYTQSDKNLFIFTAGSNPSDAIQGYVGKISDSLREHLEQFRRRVSEDYRVYKYPIVSIPWMLIIVLSGALGLFPKRVGWRGRLRLIGRATLIFSTTLPLLGLAAINFSWRHGFDKWVNMGSTVFCIAAILPFLCAALSAWRGGKRLWRVFLWTAGVNVLPAAAAFAVALAFFQGIGSIDGAAFFGTSIVLIYLGLLCGICFGLTHADNGTSAVADGRSR
jgi:hypothetical protein